MPVNNDLKVFFTGQNKYQSHQSLVRNADMTLTDKTQIFKKWRCVFHRTATIWTKLENLRWRETQIHVHEYPVY